MEKTELDPLITLPPSSCLNRPTQSVQSAKSSLERRQGKTPSPEKNRIKMHHPQHLHFDDGTSTTVATHGPSRQLFREKLSTQTTLPSELSRDYGRTFLPTNTASTDATDSLNPYNDGMAMTTGQEMEGMTGETGGLPRPQDLSPPGQLHAADCRNQLEQGHSNFAPGGSHDRYRDYGGTLVEVPEEIYAVRKAALTVLDPITSCWVSSFLL